MPTLFKQQGRRRLRKRHFKSEFALPQTLSRLFHITCISFNSSKVSKFFWSWILKDGIKVQEKKKQSCCRVYPSSTKREIRHFHVVVVQLRQNKEMNKKAWCCCFANINLLLFWRSRCLCRCRPIMSSTMSWSCHRNLGPVHSYPGIFDTELDVYARFPPSPGSGLCFPEQRLVIEPRNFLSPFKKRNA